MLIGALYFTGFTGVLLVITIFLQDGVGFTALQAGLVTTPFAVGTAVMSPIAGRLVSRLGRLITVLAISVMMSGLVLVVILLPDDVRSFSWPLLAVPLLLAGLGGGAVISPNQTLSLWSVPPRMGVRPVLPCRRVSGSAARSARRSWSRRTGSGRAEQGRPVAGLQIALITSLAIVVVALGVAVWDWRRH